MRVLQGSRRSLWDVVAAEQHIQGTWKRCRSSEKLSHQHHHQIRTTQDKEEDKEEEGGRGGGGVGG